MRKSSRVPRFPASPPGSESTASPGSTPGQSAMARSSSRWMAPFPVQPSTNWSCSGRYCFSRYAIAARSIPRPRMMEMV